jgi:penicillin amidase
MNKTRVIRWSGLIGCGSAFLVLLAFAWIWNRVESSLPQIDGELQTPGLSAPVEVNRDAQGVVSIKAATRSDAAHALGFAHAQDRFFQMDLSRRRAAGELAQLFGDAALPFDRATVGHRFRQLAEHALTNLPDEQRVDLEAYTRGVNAGLRSFQETPWEYAVLRSEPREWTPADCGLVFFAMVLELQDEHGSYERTLNTLRDNLGSSGANFFNPLIGPRDSAFDGSTLPLPPPPGPGLVDLRTGGDMPAIEVSWNRSEMPTIGSNAMAISGSSETSTRSLIAGDPHLAMAIPNTWYRAQIEWPHPEGGAHRVNGVSLPGVPGIVIGSNGNIAWTFTNATVDTGDLVPVDLNQVAPELLYHFQGESLEFEERVDVITLKNGDTEEVASTWTVFGPIVARTAKGKSLAYKWTFHDAAAINFDILNLATATSVDEALAIAGSSGMPNQNLFVADQAGNTAWALTGKLPRRFGFDGRYPVSWTFGDRGWDGFLTAPERPVVRGSVDQPLWSGNQRKVSGEALALLGDAGYDGPSRSGQIAEALFALEAAASPEDMLRIQLDDRGAWLERWRKLLISSLKEIGVERDVGERGEVLAIIEEWTGHAAAKSAGYRILREWRFRLAARTLEPIFAKCLRKDPAFRYQRLRYEDALWALHRDEPSHLLTPDYTSWDDLRISSIDDVIAAVDDSDLTLSTYHWGEANRLSMSHPFAHILPGPIAKILNMPTDPQSGDSRMPRVARPAHGASMRFAVSPGDEESGYLHLPGGQNGNPLSPFYRAGHYDWFTGKPTPFLPGEPQHFLVLRP